MIRIVAIKPVLLFAFLIKWPTVDIQPSILFSLVSRQEHKSQSIRASVLNLRWKCRKVKPRLYQNGTFWISDRAGFYFKQLLSLYNHNYCANINLHSFEFPPTNILFAWRGTIKHLAPSPLRWWRYQPFDYNCKFRGSAPTLPPPPGVMCISKLWTTRYSYLLSTLAYVGPHNTLETIIHCYTRLNPKCAMLILHCIKFVEQRGCKLMKDESSETKVFF